MSDEIILDLSFNNQTVTDLTGNWTLDAAPNATYEQIEGRDGYSIVTGSLGRCIVLNAVDQNTVYNEYTVDFDMFVKSTYTSSYYAYKIIYMWSRVNPGSEYNGRIGNVLDVRLQIGGSELAGTTDYSPIGRWVHVTLTSGPTEVDNQYCTTVYVDGVKLIDRTDIHAGGVNPFALSQQIMLLTRDTEAKLMPNGPGICLNTFKVVAGIHMPDQKPAISLRNLSRVFNNFCTWLKGQLSTVALTGSYNDLSDKPTISTVNDGTLTIQKNGTNVATFTANQSTAATANITVPTAVSELTNDSGYLTSSSNLDASKLTSGTVDIARLPQGALERLVKVANEAARYALTTADVQLGDTVQQLDTGIMYVVTDTDHLDSAAGYTEYTAGTAASVPWSGVTGKPTFAAVATSGAYSDLTGTPTIPTVNDATLTIQRNGTTLDTFTANASVDKTINISTADDTKIPLAGTNALSGDLVPASNGTINLGDTSHFFNYGYFNNLSKKENGLRVVYNNTRVINISRYDTPTSNLYAQYILYKDKDGEDLVNFQYGYETNLTSRFQLKVSSLVSGKSDLTINYRVYADGSKSIAPQTDNDVSLGSSGYRFINIFGYNLYTAFICSYNNTSQVAIYGGTSYQNGAEITVFGKDHPNNSGCVYLVARDGTNTKTFIAKPNGTLTWGSKNVAMQEDVIPRSGGAVLTGTKLARVANDKDLDICGGTGYTQGSYISVRGKSSPSGGGTAVIGLNDGTQSKSMGFYPSGTWTWNGTACQITSDQRYKQQITQIDDKLLDAWEDVELSQFKYNDAVDQKGDNARLHTGYVVQQIDEACKSHNVDISEYGLYCHEVYQEETREVEHEDGTKTIEVVRPASEHYSLRYTEVLVVECAYLRKKLKELTARIEQLEKEQEANK